MELSSTNISMALETQEDIEQIMENISNESDYGQVKIFDITLNIYRVLGIVCLILNLINIFVILKHRRLRQEKSYIIILNFILIDTVFITYTLIKLRPSPFDYVLSMDCYLIEMIVVLFQAGILVMTILTIHWYIKLYYPLKYPKFNKYVGLILSGVYIFIAFFTGSTLNMCLNFEYFSLEFVIISLIWCIVFFIVFILFMIIINIAHVVKRRQLTENKIAQNVPFVLSNVFFLSKLPIPFIVTCALVGVDIETAINWIPLFCSLILVTSNAIYFSVILLKFDGLYRIFLRHTLTCKSVTNENEIVEPPVLYKYDNIVENGSINL